MNTEQEQQGTLRDILYVLFKHQAKIVIIFLTVVVTVTIGSFLMTPVYEASSKILLKLGRENVYMPINPVAAGSPPVLFDSSREERINSAVEILKGRNLIEKVLQEIGVTTIYPEIDKNPLFSWPIQGRSRPGAKKLTPLEKATLTFEKNFSVEAVRKSDVITIAFEHKDPGMAARVVNTLIDHFLEHHLQVYKQPQKYTFFDDQVKLLYSQLKDSENELETFRQEHNISSLEEQKSLLLKQISDLEIELAKTRSEISENEGKLRALKASTATHLAQATMGEETELNPYAISSIRSRLAELKLREQELLNKYTEDSIFVTNIRQEIARAQDLLTREEKSYHDKVVNSITHTLNALKSKEENQKQHLDTYQQQLSQINSIELKLKELERQVKLNEENYQLYVKNMEEARISNAMDNQKIANISVVEPALPPIKPVKPKKLLNILLSVILGGVAGIGVAFTSEYFSHSFNNSEDIKKHLGLQVLASIPEFK